jgi:uncharacterized membrane protein
MYKYILIFILWFLNLELSLGNIWLRPNQDGVVVFTLINIIPLIKAPFTIPQFWYMWDINIFTFFALCLTYIYLIEEFLQL